MINSLNTKLDTSKITPNCEWFIENVLNGDKKNTERCIWYQNISIPFPPIQ